MFPPLPSLTKPVAVSTMLPPAFLVPKVSVKADVSPVARVPEVIVGVTDEAVVPS